MRIILAGNISKNIYDPLLERGFEIIKSPFNPNLLKGLNYHPDMQLARADGSLVCDPSLVDYYKEKLSQSSNLMPGNKVCSCNYPGDVAYNIKVVKNTVFHNFKFTDSVLMNLLSGKEKADVTQGYSGCSICNVCDCGIITSDRVIFKKASQMGIDALLIRPGGICLEGFDYGFIGGASFCFENTLYFFGDVKTHPDGDKIIDFCQKHGVCAVSLADVILSDYGSAVVVD